MMVTGRMLAALAFNWADSTLTYGLGLVVVLLIGAGAITLVKRWRQQDKSVSMSPSEQLAQYRSLYEQGVMSKEEFDRLRALLRGQLRADTKTPPTPAGDPKAAAVQSSPPAATPPTPPASENVQTTPTPEGGNGKV